MKKEIQELKEVPEGIEDFSFYYTLEYYEPLLEYVGIVAEKYHPATLNYAGSYAVSRAIGEFALRYFHNEIVLDSSKRDEFLNNKDIIGTIEMMGYDLDTFWYLILFIKDFSHGFAKEGFNSKESPRKLIKEFTERVFNNIKNFNKENFIPTYKEKSMKLSLEIKGSRKFTINDPDTIFHLSLLCSSMLNSLDGNNTLLDISNTALAIENGFFQYEELNQSVYIWCFAKMFLAFFDLKPPERKRAPKGSTVSLDKRLLVSNLIYLIFDKEEFQDSTDYLNEIFQRFKNKKFNRINGLYI